MCYARCWASYWQTPHDHALVKTCAFTSKVLLFQLSSLFAGRHSPHVVDLDARTPGVFALRQVARCLLILKTCILGSGAFKLKSLNFRPEKFYVSTLDFRLKSLKFRLFIFFLYKYKRKKV